MLYKRGPMKNFSKFTDKQKNKPSGGVLSKDVLENFAKLTEEHLSWIICFSKVAGSKPETVGSSCCRSSVRKGIPKNLYRKTRVLESLFNKVAVAVLRVCNSIKANSNTGVFL